MKLSKAQMQVLMDRVQARTPVPQPQDQQAQPGMMPQGTPGQPPMGMPPLPQEFLDEASGQWDNMQDGVGPTLYDGMHNESPMSRGMHATGRDSFVSHLGGMMAGQGKRDPELQGFIESLMQSQGKQVVPGYGLADDADMEVINAFYGGGDDADSVS